MGGARSSLTPGARHSPSAGRGFRKLSLFSETETFEAGDMFSGGSDIELHRMQNAFASVQRADLGEISICRVRSTGHDVRVREPHALTLIVPLSGSITVEDDFGRRTARPGTALLAPAGRRFTRVEPDGSVPFLGVPVLIPAGSMENRLRASGLDRTVLIDASRSALHAEAIRLVAFLHDELRNGAGLLRRAKAAENQSDLLKEVIGDILAQTGDAPSTQDVAGSVQARRVRAAEEFMLENLAEILTVADVARELEISTRTLELAFRTVHEVSPHQYVASLRLAVSRRMLLSDPEIRSVTEVCMACGIGHAGRFAIAYRERYGESPSETLRQR